MATAAEPLLIEARDVLRDLLINHPKHFTPAANALLDKLESAIKKLQRKLEKSV